MKYMDFEDPNTQLNLEHKYNDSDFYNSSNFNQNSGIGMPQGNPYGSNMNNIQQN